MDLKIDIRIGLVLTTLLLLSPEVSGCTGSYLENCYVYVSCYHNDIFNIENDIEKYDEVQRSCQHKIHVGIGTDQYGNLEYRYGTPIEVNYKLNYNYHKPPGTEESIPNIQNVANNRITSLEANSNTYEKTPTLNEMEKLETLSFKGNFITQAKLYNENPLTSLKILDYSNNRINSFDVQPKLNAYTGLTHLNVSHNSLKAISLSAIGFLDKLLVLDLSFNQIDSLEARSFQGLLNLVELYLDANKLESLNVETFELFENLKVLSVYSNKIMRIENNFFKKMNNLVTVNFKNNSLDKVTKNTFEVLNNLQSVDLSFNNIRVIAKNVFKGKNISLYIKGNKLEGSIGRGILEGANIVTELDLSNQLITEIEDFAFNMLDQLILLNVSSNRIEKIAKLSFKTLKKLRELDISNNRILYLDFDNTDLTSLNTLNANNNFIHYIKVSDFMGLSDLRHLVLANNNISRKEDGVFKPLSELTTLELSNNPLFGDIDAKTLQGLGSLVNLDLSRSRLNVIHDGAFSGLECLKHLNLSRCNTTQLSYDVFNNNVEIVLIDLSFNKLTSFHVNNSHITNLKELYLNNNFFYNISSLDFDGLRHVTNLKISHNYIANIDSKAFSSLNSLYYLDLSYNPKLEFHGSLVENNTRLEQLSLSGTGNKTKCTNMEHVPLNELILAFSNISDVKSLNLSYFNHLSSLDLSNNNIDSIEKDIFNNLTNLRSLDLSFNRISSIQPGSFKGNVFLDKLNLSNNNLFSINYGIFKGMQYVTTIDLSFNKLSELNSDQFFEILFVKNLYLDGNKLNAIDVKKFTDLKLISIGNNPLKCEIISDLKRVFGSVISSLKTDYHSDNIDGITCNVKSDNDLKDSPQVFDPVGYNSNVSIISILGDIRKIMLKNNPATIQKDITFSIKETDLNKLNIIVEKLENNSDKLFQRILAIVTQPTNFTAVTQTPTTTTESYKSIENSTDLTLSKKEFNLEKNEVHKKLDDIENKITSLKSHLDDFNPGKASDVKTEKIVERGSSILTEVCMVLILGILVCSILFKIYLYKLQSFRPHSRSSARHIAESIEC